MTTCACGCGGAVPYSRGAKYASARCRAKASRERNSPVLTANQCRALRRAEWWLRDYRDFLLPVIREGGMSDETNATMEKQCQTLQALAAELGRIARGQGQLPLKLRARGARADSEARSGAALP